MAGSKIAIGLEKLIKNLSKGLGELQIGVNKILWGRSNIQPVTTVKYGPTPTSNGANVISYTAQIPTAPSTTAQDGSKFKSFAQSGLFNILNALNSVDLCEIVNYAYDNINIKKKPRPKDPQGIEKTFYAVQDAAGEVVKFIDKYTAYPNVFIGSYLGVGPNAIPPVLAVERTDAPVQGGIAVQKYNTFFLMQSIKDVFTIGNEPNSLLTTEELGLISSVPGLASKLNFVKDFLGSVDQYVDYRNIPDTKLQELINKINRLRAICTAIQVLNFKDPRGLVNATANYLGVDIRSQIQKLSKFIDPTKIIPELKRVNSALQAFIKIAKKVQSIINLGQFFIKLAILFYKVFKFIIVFFGALPIPLIFSTAGIQTVIQDAKDKAKNESDGVLRILRGLNSFLSIVTVFVRYLLVNTIELLARLEILLSKIQTCDSLKDSDILYELQQTYANLSVLKDQLEQYVINYESKTSPDTALFGKYQIRVIEEQLVETTIVNRRRRGIALDMNGIIVAESDLTFATDTAIIIEEVKQLLVSKGLVQPGIPRLDADSLAVITESLNFLDNNDVLDNDLNITPGEVENANNLDENQGLGLQAFVNNLKGGKKLRTRMREQLATQRSSFRTQIDKEKIAAQNSINASVATSQAQGKTISKFRVTVNAPIVIGPYILQATNQQEAITFAKKLADPRNANPTWTYTVTQI
jgi:hypothetical protein